MLDKLLKLLTAKNRENAVTKTPQDVYRGISEQTGIPKEDIAAIGGIESQHGKYNQNMGGGSPKGMMQIMPRLAEAIRPGSSKTLSDMNTQQDVASNYINLNEPSIKEIRTDNDLVDKYISYNLGQGQAKKFMSADDNHKVTDVLSHKIIRNNPGLYNHNTVGDARVAIRAMLNKGKANANFEPDIQDLFRTESEKKYLLRPGNEEDGEE